MRLKKSGVWTSLLLCGLLVLAPTLAEAAAGSGRSQGSRGSRTYSPSQSQPLERSTTAPQRQAPAAQQAAPQAAPVGGMAAQQRPGFGMGSPIMTGIMAGLAGSFIGNMLFGGSHAAAQTAQNPEASPTGTFLGGMLPFLLIGGIGLLAFLFFRRRSQAASRISAAE